MESAVGNWKCLAGVPEVKAEACSSDSCGRGRVDSGRAVLGGRVGRRRQRSLRVRNIGTAPDRSGSWESKEERLLQSASFIKN